MPVVRTSVTLRQPWLSGRPLHQGLRLASLVSLGATVLVAGFIVFTPGPPAPSGQTSLHRWLALWQVAGAQPDFVTFAFVEWLANVLMFVPIGFLFAGAVRPGWRCWAVPIAAAGSVFIELVQLFIPDRVSSVSDVIANTTGALLGVVLLVALTERLRAVVAGPVPRPERCGVLPPR